MAPKHRPHLLRSGLNVEGQEEKLEYGHVRLDRIRLTPLASEARGKVNQQPSGEALDIALGNLHDESRLA